MADDTGVKGDMCEKKINYRMHWTIQMAVLVAFLGATIGILKIVEETQPEPYMDEIFHIPQAQNYCSYNFSHWNNKITTLPGLYLASVVILKPWSLLSGIQLVDACSTFTLRFVNVLFLAGNLWLIWLILIEINNDSGKGPTDKQNDLAELKAGKPKKVKRKNQNEIKMDAGKVKALPSQNSNESEDSDEEEKSQVCLATALVLSSFPLLYFYTFLYYTDMGSTFMVLMTYWLSLQDDHVTAAFSGTVSVVFRQTNIIWVAFIAATAILGKLKSDLSGSDENLFSLVIQAIGTTLGRVKDVLKIGIPYLLVFIAFVIFLVKNNGIVVGDRSSHQACINIPQLFYFVSFTVGFFSPVLISISYIHDFFCWTMEVMKTKGQLLFTVIILCLMILLIWKLTYVHPYLLADNRHYPFYIWKKIYERHWTMKYLLIPIYYYASWATIKSLRETQSALWILLYVCCVAIVTVPQKLLEFRYFLIPYLMFRIHVRLQPCLVLGLELLLYLLVNIFTIALFLYKPFHWESEDGYQRFMW